MSETPFPSTAASLPVRVAIYLPSAPEPALTSASDIEAAVAKTLCELFGGVTAYPAKGTFALASGRIQTEPVTVLEAYGEREAWEQHRDGVAAMARLLARLLGQESVGCSVDGKMVLVEAVEEDCSAIEKAPRPLDVYALLRGAID
jgi:hypothetical protein